MTAQFDFTGPRPGRRGSTLIVVIALLASLMLLGFLFLTLASQEQENAYLFAEAAKEPQSAGSDYFDFALEQLILGARDDLYNSALWGGRASLLPTMFGNDLQAYNGAGVNLAWDTAWKLNGASPARPAATVDQGFNGGQDGYANGQFMEDGGDAGNLPDPSDDWLNLNLSPSAWFANGSLFPSQDIAAEVENEPNGAGMVALPAADVEYTYPDHASPFLAYIGYEATFGQPVVIPSFHRPQYLRDLANALGKTAADWTTDPDLARRSMRPHRGHIAVTDSGSSSGETRFVNDAAVPVDADLAEIGAFPFDGSFNGTNFTTLTRDEGVFGLNSPPSGWPAARFHVDADNDGVNEAVLLDLDYPVQVSADGTKTFVPLFAMTVYDADALFNLNAHGNAFGDLTMHDGSGPVPFGDAEPGPSGDGAVIVSPTQNDHISRSNQALGPHEVNPQIGLDADPSSASGTELDQHSLLFGHVPANDRELANMEWWFILAGRAEIDTSQTPPIKSLFPGRWGEDGRLRTGAEKLVTGSDPVNAPKFFPYPGFSGQDDDGDIIAGAGATGITPYFFDFDGRVFPNTTATPPYRQPLDYRGMGRFVQRLAGGKLREFDATFAPFRQPKYVDYVVPNAVTGFTSWLDISGSHVGLAGWRNYYSNAGQSLIDHPNETQLGGSSVNGGQDAIFSPGETATLHLSNTDQSAVSFSERLLTLVPYNFDNRKSSARAAEIQARRKMFTTTSTDLKTHGSPVRPDAVANRLWEYDPELDDKNVSFPPVLGRATDTPPSPAPNVATGQSEPFRPEVRELLRNDPGAATSQTLMRKLSVNHVAEQVTNPSDPAVGRVRLRPLTPHPIGLPAAAVGRPIGLSAASAMPPAAPAFGMADAVAATAGAATWRIPHDTGLQEWNARRDRQNLARDIYVLLYTLGKANTTSGNPVATSNAITDWTNGTGPVYSLRELREMAQFAVNVVDAADPDDTITCFVFDLNLADGFTNFDDGYADPIDPVTFFDSEITVDADGDGLEGNDCYDQTNLRGMVYGVETQRLTLGEAMFVLANKIDDGSGGVEDRSVTEWNDEEVRDFSYIELMNVAPEAVDFTRQQWQIAVKPPDLSVPSATQTVATVATERRLTPVMGGVGTGPAAVFSIASAGDDHNRDRMSPSAAYTAADPIWPVPASRIRINPTETAGTVDTAANFSPAWAQIAPFAGATLDLLNAPPANYRINEGTPTGGTDRFRDGVAEDAYRVYTNPTTLDPSDPEFADNGLLYLGDEGARDLLAENETSGSKFVTVELRRRLNVSRMAPDATGSVNEAISKDNPWIVVDRMVVPLQILKIANTDETATLTPHFDQMKSLERVHPLWRRSTSELAHTPQPPAPLYIANSLGGYYASSPSPQTLWQPHYNRPFASLGDVLGVPLYGPELLTGLPNGDVGLARNEGGAAVLNRARVAAARVLFPDGSTPGLGPTFYDNLWYRAFEYLSLPEADGGRQNYADDPWFTVDVGFAQVNDRLRRRGGDIAGPYQRFGKLNLNTLRHPHVLAGILDDFSVTGRPDGPTPRASWNMPSMAGERLDQRLPLGSSGVTDNSRAWWRTFLISRDGYDPYTSLILPGLPVGRKPPVTVPPVDEVVGRPFRSTSTALRTDGVVGGLGDPAQFGDVPDDLRRSLADTVFRRLPGTDVVTNPTTAFNARGLFELGGRNASNTGGEEDTANFDFTTRYRLLSKVLNHSTTRSNVFLVFIRTEFFKAKIKYTAATDERYVRIGEWEGTPGPRAFFVVDRTEALKSVSPSDLPQRNEYVSPGQSAARITSSFARSADGAPTFDWKSLVKAQVRIE